MNFRIGQKIHVKDHVEYQYLTGNTIIDPPARHQVSGYDTRIADIYFETQKNETGNPIVSYVIVTENGNLVSPEWIETQ